MDMLAAMDRFVIRTGLYRVAGWGLSPRPRSLRWSPVAALIALPAGAALALAGGHSRPLAGAGIVIFYFAFLATIWIRIHGPRLVAAIDRPLDEREKMVKLRASHISASVIIWAVILFCLYGAWASLTEAWLPRRPMEWVSLALGIEGYAFALPALVASWLLPRPDAED